MKVSLITGVSKRLYPLVLSRSDLNQQYPVSAQINLQAHVYVTGN